MKKKPATKRTTVAKTKPGNLVTLITEVRSLIQSARRGVASVIDTFQVLTNYEIGLLIFEHDQKGEKRAEYGAQLLTELSGRLTEEFGRGFSVTNLKLMRQFFIENQHRIGQQPTDQLAMTKKSQQPAGKLGAVEIQQQTSAKSLNPFTLSWTHYVELLPIKDPGERCLYEIEATNEGWSVPELRRQKASCLYHRLALSRDKFGIRKLAKEPASRTAKLFSSWCKYICIRSLCR
jgi:predicted nuclease of restriction endonuclease-like (RecB) superfamily